MEHKEAYNESNYEPNVDNLVKRIFAFLEDGEWRRAEEYCERVLDYDIENAYAYLGKLMIELKVPIRKWLL